MEENSRIRMRRIRDINENPIEDFRREFESLSFFKNTLDVTKKQCYYDDIKKISHEYLKQGGV